MSSILARKTRLASEVVVPTRIEKLIQEELAQEVDAAVQQAKTFARFLCEFPASQKSGWRSHRSPHCCTQGHRGPHVAARRGGPEGLLGAADRAALWRDRARSGRGFLGAAGPRWMPLLTRKRWGVASGGPFWSGFSCSPSNIPF